MASLQAVYPFKVSGEDPGEEQEEQVHANVGDERAPSPVSAEEGQDEAAADTPLLQEDAQAEEVVGGGPLDEDDPVAEPDGHPTEAASAGNEGEGE